MTHTQKRKELQEFFKISSICFMVATYLTFLFAIISASTTNWLVTLDFNYYNEGLFELILMFVGLLFMLFWFISYLMFRSTPKGFIRCPACSQLTKLANRHYQKCDTCSFYLYDQRELF